MISPVNYLSSGSDTSSCRFNFALLTSANSHSIAQAFSNPGGVRPSWFALFVILRNAAGRADELFSTTSLVSSAACLGVVRDALDVFVRAPHHLHTRSSRIVRFAAILKSSASLAIWPRALPLPCGGPWVFRLSAASPAVTNSSACFPSARKFKTATTKSTRSLAKLAAFAVGEAQTGLLAPFRFPSRDKSATPALYCPYSRV